MKIAYQGTKGSFSHQSIKKIASESVGLSSFKAVYESVEKGEVDLGLLPIENSLAGMIYETIDLLSEGNLQIVGELVLKVEHNLLALAGAKIEKVLSHPKALAQCTKLFEENPSWAQVPHFDTAGAAQDISESKDLSLAAIASKEAAQMYGLEVIKENIQDRTENFTRFFLISKNKTKGSKGTICFTLEHTPGSLAKTLNILADEGIDLTSIVSRPIKDKPFEYLFFVSFISQKELPKLNTKTLKLLGTYETISDRPHSG